MRTSAFPEALEQFLAEIVDAAVAISNADFGNVQLLDREGSRLRIVAQRGFPRWWLDFWESVTPGRGACGRALERGQRVVVEDVEESPLFVGTPELEMQRKAGVRAVQSTPIVASDGQPLGMFTTHYKRPYRPDARTLQLLDLLAHHAAVIIERSRYEEEGAELKRLNEDLKKALEERTRAEVALRLTEAKSRGIISIAADAIISIDEDQRITLFNEGAEKIFGYTRAEVLGAPFDTLIPERLRAIHRRHVENFAAGADGSRRMGDRGDAAICALRKNGDEFPADAAISKLEIGGETVLTVVLRDITEQKRIERVQSFLADVGPVLATTLEYDETVSKIAEVTVRHLADFCIVDIVEESGHLRRLQARARETAKEWVVDALLQTPLDHTRPYLAAAALESRKPLLIERATPEIVASWAQNDEHLRALRGFDAKSMIAVPLLLHRKLLGILVLISSTRPYERADLRVAEALAHRAALAIENARLYLEAKRAIEARDVVLGIVAHDLRHPLSAILMSASLLGRPGAQPESLRKKSAHMIARGASRMNRLIEDLLDVTRIEAGPLCMDLAWVSVAEILSECVECQKPMASSASIELRLSSAKGLPPRICADRDRVLQVFENLIGNAIKFTPPGGQITVSAEAKAGEVVFAVRDTGCGIAADDLPHVYDRFWHARDGRRGTGLGLAIVKGIVAAHGGRAWAESIPGRGSTFFFSIATADREEHLPRVAHVLARRSPPDPSDTRPSFGH